MGEAFKKRGWSGLRRGASARVDLVRRADDGAGVTLAGEKKMDEFAHVLEGGNEAIEARADIRLVKRRQRAREEAARLAVILRINPGGAEAGLSPVLEIGARLMLRRVQPGEISDRRFNIAASGRDRAAGAAEGGAGERIGAGCGDRRIAERLFHAEARIVRVAEAE